MLFLKPQPTPFLLIFFSACFATCAILISAIPYVIKLVIILTIFTITLLNYFYTKHRTICYAKYLADSQQWLLMDQNQNASLASLLPNSYVGRYMIILNWCRYRTSVFFRWQFDEKTWRQMRVNLLNKL